MVTMTEIRREATAAVMDAADHGVIPDTLQITLQINTRDLAGPLSDLSINWSEHYMDEGGRIYLYLTRRARA